MKPIKTEYFGTFIQADPGTSVEHIEEQLNEWRNHFTYKLQLFCKLAGRHAWANIEECSYIKKEPSEIGMRRQFATYGFKIRVRARAFVLKRFCEKPQRKRHPRKLSVPKRKRGKYIFTKNLMT